MVGVASRHPRLNLLNIEATAAAIDTADVVWLSPRASEGVLPDVLNTEGVRWRVHHIDRPSGPDDDRG
jgi:hypothetical protein